MARGLKADVGAETVTQNGYVSVKTEDGWKYKHHLLIEKKLGRPLEENERVYFKDGSKTNLKPNNLEVRVVSPRIPSLTTINKVRKRVDKLESELEDIRAALTELEERFSL